MIEHRLTRTLAEADAALAACTGSSRDRHASADADDPSIDESHRALAAVRANLQRLAELLDVLPARARPDRTDRALATIDAGTRPPMLS